MARDSRRFSVWLPAHLREALQQRAAVSKLSLALELRRAVERGLVENGIATATALTRVELIAIAALIAAEHNGRFLARTFPDGERRSLDLRESAVDAAERRLEECRVRADEPGSQA